MPYRKQQFINEEIYHITVKGLDDNLIFQDTDDYYRGIFSIYEFNTKNPVSIKERRKIRLKFKKNQSTRGRVSSAGADDEAEDKRDKLVEILAFCFMPNHFHLLLKQKKEGGIVKFMSKVGTGYGGYSNRKYGRRGYVFQDRFFSVHIADEDYLKNVFVYIHANPVSLIEPKWKETGIIDSKKTIDFLENYKWSSYQDYIGNKNFSSVTERDLFYKILTREEGCRKFVEYWIGHKVETGELFRLFQNNQKDGGFAS